MKSIETLEEEAKQYKELIYSTSITTKGLKQHIKELEIELKHAKRQYNKAYKTYLQYTKQKIKTETKIKTLPSTIRSRTKANMGKAINKIVGGE